ncbi:MAG: Lrp/AsnC ligand binding domain-containing protein [Candidatus Hodarchaeota archaeon]
MKPSNSRKSKEQILFGLSKRKNPSLRGVAEEIGVSSSWLRKQIQRMRKEGIINSWQLILNPRSLQQQIFFFLLKTNPNEPNVITKLLKISELKTDSELSTLEGITGDYSLIGRFHSPNASKFLDSLDHLYELVGKTGFQKFQLIEVIKAYKEHGLPCPEPSRFFKSQDEEHKKIQRIQKIGEGSEFPPSSYHIAEKLGVSQPAIYRQLKRWKDEKVILGYSLWTNFWQNNFLNTYVHVKAPLGKYRSAIDYCLQNDQVIHIYRTNQEYSLLLKTRHSTLSELNNLLKNLYQHAEVEDTLTRLVLEFYDIAGMTRSLK